MDNIIQYIIRELDSIEVKGLTNAAHVINAVNALHELSKVLDALPKKEGDNKDA